MDNKAMAGAAAAAIIAPVALVIVLAMVIVGMGSPAPAGPADSGGGNLNAKAVPAKWLPYITKAGSQCQGITAPLIAAQIDQESGWNPNATSPVGARGLAQFMPRTWPSWGKDDDHNGRVSPLDGGDAIMAQARYMCSLYKSVAKAKKAGQLDGDPIDLALFSYNAGIAAILGTHGHPVSPETKGYAPAIRALEGKYTAAGPAEVPAGSGIPGKALAYAKKWEGKAGYCMACGNEQGPTSGSFDCSGLTLYAYYQATDGKVDMFHGATKQRTDDSVEIPKSEAQPGDLVFFRDDAGQSYTHHVGLYAGNGMVINAPDYGQMVKTEPITDFGGVISYGRVKVGK